MFFKNPEKLIRIATLATLSFMVVWGLVLVIAQIQPFWVDEWRIIYNLKFKTAATIWGPLDYMQQFPRIYIAILKAFTSIFDYSYFTLRLPSYLVGTFTIFFCYRLMNRMYAKDNFNRFLFIMILVSCSTFTGYYVQIKQYTMDILLSVLAIWQLMELLEIKTLMPLRSGRYVLLCTSLLVVPFFSYSYPIAIAPAFIILFIQSISLLKSKESVQGKRKILFLKWLPAALCAFSITVFYITDVSQLMQDGGMHRFWGHLMMKNGFSWQSFFINVYNLFAEIGSGFVFWLLLGTLGCISFAFGIYTSFKNRNEINSTPMLIRLYCVALLVLVIVLYLAGKLPLGEPRLNAFTIPAISILLIYFLDSISLRTAKKRIVRALSVIIYIGVIGNIYTTFLASITGTEYKKKMHIYRSTENAIMLAQANKLPILITPEVAYPYDKTENLPFTTTIPGDWVLKTFPAYKLEDNIQVVAISDTADIKDAMKQLPAGTTSVLVGDGQSYKIINK